MHQWFVVHTLSAHEKKVQKAVEDQKEIKGMADYIDEVLLPVENISEIKKGQQKIVEKRMWPGYLLVHMTLTDESWSYVKNTPGVIDFLGGEKPTPLTEQEVEEILKDIDEKKVVQKHRFKAGDTVKIIDGVFVNFIGTITSVNNEKGRMNVLVAIFGRETQVDDLEFFQVEEVLEDEEIG